MSEFSTQILQAIESLSIENQRQVLDFVEFLSTKQQTNQASTATATPKSLFDVAQSTIGSGEGPGDLSTNLEYLQGYGQSCCIE